MQLLLQMFRGLHLSLCWTQSSTLKTAQLVNMLFEVKVQISPPREEQFWRWRPTPAMQPLVKILGQFVLLLIWKAGKLVTSV